MCKNRLKTLSRLWEKWEISGPLGGGGIFLTHTVGVFSESLGVGCKAGLKQWILAVFETCLPFGLQQCLTYVWAMLLFPLSSDYDCSCVHTVPYRAGLFWLDVEVNSGLSLNCSCASRMQTLCYTHLCGKVNYGFDWWGVMSQWFKCAGVKDPHWWSWADSVCEWNVNPAIKSRSSLLKWLTSINAPFIPNPFRSYGPDALLAFSTWRTWV